MAPAREMTDQDLLRAYVHSRDVDSLGVFLGRYEGPLMRLVTNFLRDESAAQDIVQETFLQVAKKPSKLLDVSSCHNWLLKIARNLSIDHLRRLLAPSNTRRPGRRQPPCPPSTGSRNRNG